MGRLRKNLVNETKLFSNDYYFVNNPKDFKQLWKTNVFKNNNSIEIEVGSGKGLFIVQKAITFPNINFIAIDKFSTVLFQILKKINLHCQSNETNLNNIKIICADAKDLCNYFDKNEIDKCYLNFSDPWPKKRHEKNRLTSLKYLKIYDCITKKNSPVEFKTDNLSLYEYTKNELIKNSYKIILDTIDLYASEKNLKDNFPTEYEIKWVNKNAKIKKIIFLTK